MTWGEALRLTVELASDPSSRVGAALAGWSRPTSHLELILMDQFDLSHQIAWGQAGGKGSKPKPYPRPWPERQKSRTKPQVTQAEVVAALRFAGHEGPIPTV